MPLTKMRQNESGVIHAKGVATDSQPLNIFGSGG